MKYKTITAIFVCLALFATFSSPTLLRAQSAETQVSSRKAQLEAELRKLEQEIDVQQKIVDTKSIETQSLERDVSLLEASIRKTQLGIQARDINIEKLSRDIVSKQFTIEDLNAKMVREKRSLAQLIRKRNEIDSFSLVEVMLGNQNLSDFFSDVDSFTSVELALKDSFQLIEDTKSTTQTQKTQLEGERSEEQELRNIQIQQKKKIEVQEREKAEILRISKGQEDLYRQVLKNKEKSAAQIRAELFTLRGSSAIPFGRALELANHASELTGVRSALILGVIAEESNLGENVGTGNWRTDMHPTRDRPVFEQITAELGLDPDLMPVSKKPWYGWGGAMGPAQFIPSTWVLYQDQIGKITGHNPPNPWDPEDAFVASAVLLRDNGADAGTRSAERLAALRYFAGWKNALNPSYAFYGDEVMALSDKYQSQIDILGSN